MGEITQVVDSIETQPEFLSVLVVILVACVGFIILIYLGGRIMASLQEVKDAIAAIAADIVAEKNEVQAALADLKAEVQALKDQIAAGGAVTPAQLDEVIASLTSIDAGVKDISEPIVP